MPNDLQAANVRKVKCFGQALYEEYSKGHPFVPWENLPVDMQVRWDRAARAAIDWFHTLVEQQGVINALQSNPPAILTTSKDPDQAAKEALARDTTELDEGDAQDICKFPRGYRPVPKESWFSALFGRKPRA